MFASTFSRLILAHRKARGLEAVVARLAFDTCVGVSALAAALLFRRIFLGPPLEQELIVALAMPAVFLLTAFAAGVYTRLRRGRSRTKAAWLAASVLGSGVIANVLGGDPSITTLWLLQTLPAVVLARFLVAMSLSERPFVSRVARDQHGRVLLIGGAGYIGSLTVELLLDLGYRVRVLDRLMYGGESLRRFEHHENFELIDGDATDIARLTAAARNTSAVIHLAGLVGDPACEVDPDFTRHANIVATRMAKEVAKALGVPRFIFASSCSVYGASDKLMREGDRLNPVSLYAQTKIDSENELLEGGNSDFCVTVLRFATVFGYSLRPRFDLVANLMTAQALQDGEIMVIGPDQWRPFVHVRDLARAIVMVLQAEPHLVQNEIFNVGDDRLNMTIGQLGQRVSRVVSAFRDVRVTVRQNGDDRRNYHVSFEKIRSRLGFRAEILLEDGVREIAEKLRAASDADFRAPVYSNYATTRVAADKFHDPSEVTRLYAPLATPEAGKIARRRTAAPAALATTGLPGVPRIATATPQPRG